MPDRVKEKLVELLNEASDILLETAGGLNDNHGNGIRADHLIANGVTVHEGKPIEAFLQPIDTYKGLKAKYLVFKADTRGKVDNCFVLRPDKDPVAVEALRAYARNTDNETLAEDIYKWVGKGEQVQEWISVKDRLPEPFVSVLVQMPGKEPFPTVREGFISNDGIWQSAMFRREPGEVTHWQPMPQPPKGE